MIYILHIDPPLKHAHHYVGWTKDKDVTRRVRQHIEQTGSRPSKLVGAALAAGCVITLAGVLEGDRNFERRLKNRGGASRYCPMCRALKKSPGDSHSPQDKTPRGAWLTGERRLSLTLKGA